MKVSYKGVTGELLKLERVSKEDINIFPGTMTARKYALDIADASDGHKHRFENVDIRDVQFIGITVTMV